MSHSFSLRSISLSLFLFACTVLVGCGGGNSGPAEFDASAVPARTAADDQADADYEAQMAKEHAEQYGK